MILVHHHEILPKFGADDLFMKNPAIWQTFNFLVGLLVIFRTSQSYTRFWTGTTSAYKMSSEWYSCCAMLMSFSNASGADPDRVKSFQNKIIRLFSMLHAVAFGELEDAGEKHKTKSYKRVAAFTLDIIDIEGLGSETLRSIRDSELKVELVYQWILDLVVAQLNTGVLNVAPAIMTRSMQELSIGMEHYHESLTMSAVPFPFPYAVTCDMLLVVHWLLQPFTVVQWCAQPGWACIYALIMQFMFWSLNLIAIQLDNPFGCDPNDIDAAAMQVNMNNRIRQLLATSQGTVQQARLREGANQDDLVNRAAHEAVGLRGSFIGVWEHIENGSPPARRRSVSSVGHTDSLKGSPNRRSSAASDNQGLLEDATTRSRNSTLSATGPQTASTTHSRQDMSSPKADVTMPQGDPRVEAAHLARITNGGWDAMEPRPAAIPIDAGDAKKRLVPHMNGVIIGRHSLAGGGRDGKVINEDSYRAGGRQYGPSDYGDVDPKSSATGLSNGMRSQNYGNYGN